MKGIILAGGVATRMFPITLSITKQLLPVYDKPMIYYSISTLMSGGIRDILIIVSENQISNFTNLLGNGSQFGVNISYKIQKIANGLPEAFIIGEDFIRNSKVALILGDNIFYSSNFSSFLRSSIQIQDGATLFLYNSLNPESFGVVEISSDNKIISIEEKPKNPKSNYVVTGLYLYDEDVSYYSKKLKKSSRNELEITDLNNIYLENQKLNYKILGKGFSWMDTGTFDSLHDASEFIKVLEKRQGIRISVPEEIAYKNNWISKEDVLRQAFKYKNNSYGYYLNELVECENKSSKKSGGGVMFKRLKIPGTFIYEPKVFNNNRGAFFESYNEKIFFENGLNSRFVQDNNSFSVKKYTIRGLHFQKGGNAQAKLVRCVRGSIFDFIVDLRKDSKTFLCWERIELNEENRRMVFIPRGCAHGFITLEDNTEVSYKVDNFYDVKSERTLIYNDKTINIDWGIDIESEDITLSHKDLMGKEIDELDF